MTTEKQSFIRKKWGELSPQVKTKVVIVGGLLLVVFFAYGFVNTSSNDRRNTPSGRIQNALLTDATSDLAAAGMSQELRQQQKALREMESEFARLKAQSERLGSMPNGIGQNDARLNQEISELRARVETLSNQQAQGAQANQQRQTMTPIGNDSPNENVPSRLPVGVGPVPSGETQVVQPAFGEIRTIRQPEEKAPVTVEPEKPKPATPKFYLPTGSMISGVLLAGVDTPTGKAAMRDPIPVLARVKQDAILPNRYRADVKECFALLEASGDLASERAMMRLTNISCVRRDRSVIDVPAAGYAVGEDGRAGLRGRLVSKQGQVLAKAMFAGFAEGMSTAFGGGRNNFGSLGGDIDYGQSGEMGALGGASSALDRVAKYYLDLADQLHPTVEIDAGRQVTIVLLRGREMATLNETHDADGL